MNNLESQTFIPTRRQLERAAQTPEWQLERERAANKLINRLDEIGDAIFAAIDDTQCRDLEQFLNGRGDLVIGMQSEVNDLFSCRDVPLAEQPANEAVFVAATANYYASETK